MTPLDPLTHPSLDHPSIRHGFFGRRGGVSEGIYSTLNCGFGSDDATEAVAENRARVAAQLSVAADRLLTVHQIHSPDVMIVETPWDRTAAPKADAMVTKRPGIALGVLAADCAPVLLADAEAGVIGAAHAGWRGAFGGVVHATVAAMAALGADPARIAAVIGPCIGRNSYEVGEDFRQRFIEADPADDAHFHRPAPGAKPHFDLSGYLLARTRKLGLASVERLAADTLAAPDLWFSYRRETLAGGRDYGRQVSCIVLA
jgi:YfiH family protein